MGRVERRGGRWCVVEGGMGRRGGALVADERPGVHSVSSPHRVALRPQAVAAADDA